MDEQPYINALVELHEPLESQGPGDSEFTRQLALELKPILADTPKMIDMGCGTGTATLVLADCFEGVIQAVDASENFIEVLKERINAGQYSSEVIAQLEDFSTLAEVDFNSDTYDLLWSEGAAYILGFEQALKTWRPLLKQGGIAVISEMSWFNSPPQEALDFWQEAYPSMATEPENMDKAKAQGFEVLKAIRLPAKMWWDNYYNPLLKNMQKVRMNIGLNANEAMFDVLDDTDKEIALFDQYCDFYGYTFYVLKAV